MKGGGGGDKEWGNNEIKEMKWGRMKERKGGAGVKGWDKSEERGGGEVQREVKKKKKGKRK